MSTFLKIAIPAAAAVAGTAGLIGYRMMNGFLLRHEPYADDPPADENYTTPAYYQAYLDEVQYNDELDTQDWTITSKDGLKLYASYLPAEGEAVRNIILYVQCDVFHNKTFAHAPLTDKNLYQILVDVRNHFV